MDTRPASRRASTCPTMAVRMRIRLRTTRPNTRTARASQTVPSQIPDMLGVSAKDTDRIATTLGSRKSIRFVQELLWRI